MHSDKKSKQDKFNFESMKIAATHADVSVRKQAFIEYFERFDEFPSFLFDNESGMDARLAETIQAFLNDPDVTPEVRQGIDQLIKRLPSQFT